MEKYINMNDSFGNKHSVSSTKSFQTSYQQHISSLKQQLQNHQKALQTAEEIVEQYKQQNQRLIDEINAIRQTMIRTQQKYEVLQNLFIKLDKVKDKELNKETKRSQEKHKLEIQNLNNKYQSHIAGLNEKILFLEFQVRKYQEKQKKYQELLSSPNIKQTNKDIIVMKEPLQKNVMTKREQTQKSQDSLEKIYIKAYNKMAQPSEQTTQPVKQVQLVKGRFSVGRKQGNPQSRNSEFKESPFERKSMRHSQVRVNTTEDYFSQKLQMIKTTQKPKNSFIYEHNWTDHKNFY